MVKQGKEAALLFSVMFLPGILGQSTGVDPAGWNSIGYHVALLAVAVPQILLVIYLTELRTPGVAGRLGWKRPQMSDLVVGIIATALVFAAITVTGTILSLAAERSPIWEPAIRWSFSSAGLVPFVIVSTLAIGYREELFYRAYLLVRAEEAGLHPAAAIAGSTVLFAIGHLYQGLSAVVIALVIGVVLAAIFRWRGSLHGIALAHAAYNAAVLFTSAAA